MTLVTNGTFNTDASGWTPVNSTIASVAGQLRVTNNVAGYTYTYQAITVVIGQLYQVQWDAFTGTAPPIFRVANTTDGTDYVNALTIGAGQSATFTPTQTTIYIACWVFDTVNGDYANFDNISLCPAYPKTATDVINSHDAQVVGFPVALIDGFGTPDLLAVIRAQMASLIDGIDVTEALIRQLGVLVAEGLRLNDQWVINQVGQVTLVDSIFAHDAIARGLPLTLTDGIDVTEVALAKLLISVIEQLNLNDVVGPTARHYFTVTEQLQWADTLARFIGAALIENLQLTDEITGVGQLYSALTDGFNLSTDLSSSRMVFAASLADGIDITDAELIKMIFSTAIIDGINVLAGYFDPSGSVTTWSMNTKTHAVTEFTNYNFNSFARIGDHYLGATKNGLYDLSGDNDAGTSIIADIKSGLAQFAGVHLSSFKGAYIAARGGGSFVLKLTTGDGQEYDFAVTADSMKTARIDLGKGIRARYFAFELISSGQDFDLDSLEFIPLIAKRRV